jgi:hypothetical protein
VLFKPVYQACLILLISQACMAAQRSGIIGTSCEKPPFAFDFSEITSTCYINQCIKDKDLEMTTVSYLSAPIGIIDLGISDTNYLQKKITVPDTGYKASVQFLHLHLYALKTSEGNYALFLEGTNIYGGCFWFKFYWAYNDDGSREFGTPAKVKRQKENMPARSGGVEDGIKGAVDIRGRLTAGKSKICGIKLYVDEAGKVLKKVNAIP